MWRTIMKTTDFAYYLSSFLTDYLPLQRNTSRNTIRSYRDCFKLFIKYLGEEKGISIEKISLNYIERNTVTSFLLWLEQERKCSISTRNQRLAAIESFFKYIAAEKPEYLFQAQQIGSIRIKKSSKPVIEYLSVEATKILLATINTASKQGRRDLAMISLLYDSGARVQELIDLKVSDIHIGIAPTVEIMGKGNKFRIVPITKTTGDILDKYIHEFNLDKPEHQCKQLFKNKFNHSFTREGITYTLQKYATIAHEGDTSIPRNITPHILRHTKAMHLIQAGVDLVSIRDFLGHVDISTTDIYAKTNVEEKRKALKKAENLISIEMTSWEEDHDLMDFLKSIK